jgi:hypothetical protein
MNNKQTAVEWLYNHLFPKQLDGFSNEEWDKIDIAFEQAKEMEMQQTIKFANDYLNDDFYLTAEEYYTQVYGGETMTTGENNNPGNTTPNTYRKKPVTIEALQWTGNNHRQMFNFLGGEDTDYMTASGTNFYIDWSKVEGGLVIKTLEGEHIASIGDWIIKGVKGEFYPYKPDVFEMTYEKV